MPPCSLLAALAAASVQAADPSDLDRAWYLAESSRIEQALATVSMHLQVQPEDIGAHRLYTWLSVKALREADSTEALYRTWLEEDPDAVPPRVALANLLHWRNRQLGSWCEEVDDLLADSPANLVDTYWAQRALFEARGVCPGDLEAPRHALIKLGEAVPEARAYSLRLRVKEQAITAALAQELAELYVEQPWRLTYAGNLWRKTRGDALDLAREQALGAARVNLESQDPLLVESARRLFVYAEETEATLEAEERLAELDPGFVRNRFQFDGVVQWVERPEDGENPLLRELRSAARRVRPRKAVGIAKDYRERLPEDAEVHAAYFAQLSKLHEEAGQPIKALEASKAAWSATPDNPFLANQFAYSAAVAGLYLDEALEAIQGALHHLPAYDARGDHRGHGYDHWMQWTRSWGCAIADTHGWVLYRLGRHEEAAVQLRQALMLAPDHRAELHLHLGLVYTALGQDRPALRQLGRGLALAQGEDPDLEKLAYKRLVTLYQAHCWAPGGIEAWIALHAPSQDEAEDEPEGPSLREQAKAYRIGQPFPDLHFEQDGVKRQLSQVTGIRVVDLWATWCGPCVKALPNMDKLAKEYAPLGITFLAISVDADAQDVTDYFDGDEPNHLMVGWAGRKAMREARINGIPAMFVLDEQGIVQDFHSGWVVGRGGDKAARERIAESLDHLLQGEAEPGTEKD